MMHNPDLGISRLDIPIIIKGLIDTTPALTLDTVNNMITNFDYGLDSGVDLCIANGNSC